MTRKNGMKAAIVAILFLGSVVFGCARAESPSVKVAGGNATRNQSGEFINAGSGPRLPVGMKADVFSRAASGAPSPAVDDIRRLIRFRLMARNDGLGRPVTPARTFVQPEAMADGTEQEGFTLRFSDRVQLRAVPSSVPASLGAILSNESVANTRGETQPFVRTTVRGFDAVVMERCVQKWADGSQLNYPSTLVWSEPGVKGTPFVQYTLMGDMSSSALIALAKTALVLSP